MSGINISDVKISFGGTELTPIFISQSLKDAKTTFRNHFAAMTSDITTHLPSSCSSSVSQNHLFM